jgi:glycosyltransferase involved in cell wall biosynthesis
MNAQNSLSESAHAHQRPPVSVILTVANEAAHLESAINAILDSQYKGEIEVAIAVGPSNDGTFEIAENLSATDNRIKVIKNPSGRTPDGLNAAIEATKHEIIVRVDGHSEISKDYIDKAVKILQETGAVNVGGIMAAEGITPFQRAVARAMRSPIGVGPARFHTGGSAGSTDTVYLGVFKRSALDAIGGYDKRFTRAQDWELNYRLRSNGGLIWFDPSLQVTYRPRKNPRALASQYFQYGRWRSAVLRHHKKAANARYLAPPLNLIAQLISMTLGVFVNPIFFLLPMIYLSAILIASLILGKGWNEKIRLPIVLIIMHFCWGFGFITSPRTLISR